MAREVAHEYGHAVLPPVGGFRQPEDWANGYLGERLFLRWLRDDIAARRLTPDDAMGASLDKLDAWVKKHVDPLVAVAATNYPDPVALSQEGTPGMDRYMGLALYIEQISPPQVFAQSMKLAAKGPAKEYPAAIVDAMSHSRQVTLGVPTQLQGKKMWIPLGKGRLSGATVIVKRGDWAQVAPLMPSLVITYPSS